MGKRSNGTRSQSPLQTASTRTNTSKIGGSNTSGKAWGAANTQAGNTYTTSSGEVYEYGHLFSKKEESRIAAEIDSVKKALNLEGLKERYVRAEYNEVSEAIDHKGLKLDNSAQNDKRWLTIYERDYLHGQENLKEDIVRLREAIGGSVKSPYYNMTIYVSPRVTHDVHVDPYIYNSEKQKYTVKTDITKWDSKGRYISNKIEVNLVDKDEMQKMFKKYKGKKWSPFG